MSQLRDISPLPQHNISPLHVAAKWGKNNMVKILLENSAQIDAKTRDGLTPLHCAARSGHEQVVSTLLENSAPISARTKVTITCPASLICDPLRRFRDRRFGFYVSMLSAEESVKRFPVRLERKISYRSFAEWARAIAHGLSGRPRGRRESTSLSSGAGGRGNHRLSDLATRRSALRSRQSRQVAARP